jgi:hypothetical protein
MQETGMTPYTFNVITSSNGASTFALCTSSSGAINAAAQGEGERLFKKLGSNYVIYFQTRCETLR